MVENHGLPLLFYTGTILRFTKILIPLNPDFNTLKRNPEKDLPFFTKREVEILTLIAKQNTNRQIAETLSISLNTVETHRGNMIKKVKAKNFYGVMMYAFKNKLIKG